MAEEGEESEENTSSQREKLLNRRPLTFKLFLSHPIGRRRKIGWMNETIRTTNASLERHHMQPPKPLPSNLLFLSPQSFCKPFRQRNIHILQRDGTLDGNSTSPAISITASAAPRADSTRQSPCIGQLGSTFCRRARAIIGVHNGE